MTDQPGSTRFQALIESAVLAYEKQAGTPLADSGNSLAMKLQGCHSVEDIATLIHGQVQSFNDFRQRDRIFNSIKTTVSALSPISSVASVADNVGLTLLPHVTAINAILGILVGAANGVVTSCDALADMLESIGHFVSRLRLYTETSHPTPVVDGVVIELMVELISVLALVAHKLKKRRLLVFKWVKHFFVVKDINATQKRLERLLQEEDRAVGAQTLNAVEASTDVVERTLNQMKRDELLSKIQNWLSPPDPWKNFNIALKSRHSNTGAWFVNGNTLPEWKASGPSSLLWINGKPGAGKSVLCSTIIKEIKTMQQSGDASLAVYYYDFREDKKKDLHGLLSSVLFQLCEQADSYHPILSSFYSTHLNGARTPSDDELIRCLIDLLKLPESRQVYLIIDALDECPSTSSLSSPREELLSLLEDLVGEKIPNLRICVTSRPEVDIKTLLEPLAFRSISLHVEPGQKKDITDYIESIVGTNKKMQNWSLHNKQLVTDVLTRKADGMFRWVYCQLEYLADCPQPEIKRSLDKLPATLDETYESTLREIKDTNSEYARRLLLCVAVACRPLRVEELADILAFDFEARIPVFHEEYRQQDPIEAVLSTCSTLLSVVKDRGSQVVQFAHLSVKEFLTSKRFAEKCEAISSRYHISMTPAHTVITQACLGMLLYLDKNITGDSPTRFPLAEYAAKHWVEHARFEGVSQNAEEGMKQLFDRTKPHLSIWLWIHDPTVDYRQRRQRCKRLSPLRGTPLHYAASCGLHDIAKILAAEYPKDVNSQGFDDSSTPLHLASSKGHVDVVRMLMENSADVSTQDKDGRTPLHLALNRGHVDVARMLVKHSTDVSTQDKDGSTPLHLALGLGYMDVAWMLMEHNADVSAQDKDGRNPLHLALGWGHVDMARMFVEHSADVSAQDKDGWTPLHLASNRGLVDVARMLVERSADVSAQDKDGRTPLHLALGQGQVDVARMLVERSSNVSAQNKDGKTPLHLALDRGHMDMARMLVEHSPDVSAQDKDGRSPLHLALNRGYVDLAQMLVEHSPDVSAQDKDGWTALHLVLDRGCVDMARMLVERGADVLAQNKDGRTPLHLALDRGHVDVVPMLVGHSANVSAQDKNGWTPLHLALNRGYVDLAQLLVEHSADVAAQNRDGRTPLHLASTGGHMDVARMLVEYGADVSALDKDGWTPLHLASTWGHMDIARMLVVHSADVSAQDKDERSPLHLALNRGHVDVARMLVEHSADLSTQDEFGWTPLHLASNRGVVDVARMLVENNANVSAQDKFGWTPLHLASDRDRVDVARMLVEHSADVSAQDEDGRTPLHLASDRGHMSVARMLVEHSADVWAQDKDKRTPLHLASDRDHIHMVQLLASLQFDSHRTTS